MDGDCILSVAKIRKGALTIPMDIRKKANLEDGTFVSVEYKSSDGVIILKPKSLLDHENYLTLSKKGKKMIDEALDAEKSGEVIGPFSDIKEALRIIKSYQKIFSKIWIGNYLYSYKIYSILHFVLEKLWVMMMFGKVVLQ
jgi:bifunctional DNA-binding transcriptional regulator/antitoxin component of YhaV-PrlF toxin-antitoxin module